MRTKRLTIILSWIFLLYTLHFTLYTSIAFCGNKGAVPVAHWRFDEGGGPTAYDDTANNNDGTLNAGAGGTNTAVGQMWMRQGKVGGALELDGTDDYVDIGDKLNMGTSDFTVEAWFKTSVSAGQSIIYKEINSGTATRQGYSLYTRATDPYLEFVVGDGTNYATFSSVSTNYANGAWHHAVVTKTSSLITLYVDGVSVTTANSSAVTGNVTNSTSLKIGGGIGYFNGLIDDARIYNYARSAAQVMVDYNAGSAAHLGAGVDPNEGNPPTSYLPFNENTGTTAYDRSGNNNNGNISGGAAWVQGKYGTALSFDGSNDAVTVPNTNNAVIPASNAAFTISLWFNSSQLTTSTIKSIMVNETYQNSGFRYGTDSNRKLVFWASESGGTVGLTSNVALAEGKWYHAVIVYTGSTAKMYLDGVEVASTSGSIVSNTVDIKIAQAIGGKEYFKGLIDEVKIYNYARTPAQIIYDYNKGGPVAQYRFDEGSGTIAKNDYSSSDAGVAPMGWWRMDNDWTDSSGNANTGTATGATFSSSSKIGPYCGVFNGTNNYVSVTSNPALNCSTGGTISAWVKIPSTWTGSTYSNMVSKGANAGWDTDGWALYAFSSNVIGVGMRNGGTSFSRSFTNSIKDQWTHIVGTWDGTTVKVYQDGVLKTFTSQTISPPTTSTSLTIGKDGGSQYFGGQIDDVRIYNYARTAEQIYNDYKTTHGTLVGDAKFVDGKIGKALQFDGTGDYVDCGNDSMFNVKGAFTMSAWIKITAYDQFDSICGKGTKFDSATDSYLMDIVNGKIRYFIYTTSYSGPTGATTVVDNSWHYVAMVYDGQNLTGYVDGKVDLSPLAKTGNVQQVSNNFYIGSMGTSYQTAGYIDDVKLYNYARTAAQILEDATSGAARLGTASTYAVERDPWGGALPVAQWKMDENTGVLANDASGNGNNGTLTNGPTWAQGKLGSCLDFDGTNDYVDIPSVSYTLTNKLSVSAWVKAETLQTGRIASNRASDIWEYGIYANKIRFELSTVGGGGTISTVDNFTTGTWKHVCVIYDGAAGSAKIYIDGVEKATSASFSGNLNSNPNSGVIIGKYQPGNSEFFDGKIDDVRIYNYALTQAQVSWLYNKGQPVGYWRFDEATSGAVSTTASAIKDDSGNNNGTASATTFSYVAGKYGGGITFDGNDNVSCGTWAGLKFQEGNLWTASLWVKTTTDYSGAGTGKKLLSKGTGSAIAGYAISIGNINSSGFDNRIGFVIDNPPGNNYAKSFTTLPVANDGNWHHVAIVFDASNNTKVGASIYFDGVNYGYMDSPVDKASWSSDVNEAVRIGSGRNTEYFTGQLDDVRIYNYARTADQIKQDYNAGAATRLGD